MATLYVAEFPNMAAVGSRLVQVAAMPPMNEQIVAIGASSAASAPFGGSTNLIRVHADSVCSIKIGATPVAAATNARLAAGATEYFAVSPGQSVAVITNT